MIDFIVEYWIYFVIGAVLLLVFLMLVLRKPKKTIEAPKPMEPAVSKVVPEEKPVEAMPVQEEVVSTPVEKEVPPVKEETIPEVKEEPVEVVEPKTEVVEPVVEKVTPVQEPPKEKKTVVKIPKYHVSQNKDEGTANYKKWRIRKEGSDKTIRYFDTQKEAIAFAEDLAQKAGSSVVIHKVDGSIRKQDYTK